MLDEILFDFLFFLRSAPFSLRRDVKFFFVFEQRSERKKKKRKVISIDRRKLNRRLSGSLPAEIRSNLISPSSGNFQTSVIIFITKDNDS